MSVQARAAQTRTHARASASTRENAALTLTGDRLVWLVLWSMYRAKQDPQSMIGHRGLIPWVARFPHSSTWFPLVCTTSDKRSKITQIYQRCRGTRPATAQEAAVALVSPLSLHSIVVLLELAPFVAVVRGQRLRTNAHTWVAESKEEGILAAKRETGVEKSSIRSCRSDPQEMTLRQERNTRKRWRGGKSMRRRTKGSGVVCERHGGWNNIPVTMKSLPNAVDHHFFRCVHACGGSTTTAGRSTRTHRGTPNARWCLLSPLVDRPKQHATASAATYCCGAGGTPPKRLWKRHNRPCGTILLPGKHGSSNDDSPPQTENQAPPSPPSRLLAHSPPPPH